MQPSFHVCGHESGRRIAQALNAHRAALAQAARNRSNGSRRTRLCLGCLVKSGDGVTDDLLGSSTVVSFAKLIPVEIEHKKANG
jgi:hypothetical protein